jgi:hypothetical protein
VIVRYTAHHAAERAGQWQLTILNLPLIPQTSLHPPASASDINPNSFSTLIFRPLEIFTAFLVDVVEERNGMWERRAAGERVLSRRGRRRRAVETGP